uniref:helix-turn-helix domain-containing protein n=1 Tax=uncultured Sulfitobacter sp. TaxID=191468 RepID=UPI002636890E
MGSCYSHLSLDERRKIAKWLEAKMPIAEIADRLGRDASTIYRDIKRNRYTDKEIPELKVVSQSYLSLKKRFSVGHTYPASAANCA